MVNRNQANFRVIAETWESFKEKAIANGSNATTELNRFIELYVSGDINIADFRPDTPESLDKRIGDAIQKAVAPIEAELALVKNRLTLIEENQGAVINVEAIATLEQKIQDFSKITPSRLSQNAQNEPVRTNHTRSTIKGDTEPETLQCPECGSINIKKTGYIERLDKETGQKKRTAARRQCRDCGKNFSIPFEQTIEAN